MKAGSGIRCICGYEARDMRDLEEHIAAAPDAQDHSEDRHHQRMKGRD